MKTENYMKNATSQTIADTQRAASRTVSDLDRRVGMMNEAALNPQIADSGRRAETVGEEFVSVKPQGGGGGGASNPGLLIYRSGTATPFFVSIADVTDGYDDEASWSLEFSVTDGALDTTAVGTISTARYDDEPSPTDPYTQTFYRIPVIRTIGGTKYTFDIGGIYQETIVCVNGVPVVQIERIG